MSNNVKIRTEDVLEIYDSKIRATTAHTQIDVAAAESYDSVLTKIAARSPTLAQKQGLDAAQTPYSFPLLPAAINIATETVTITAHGLVAGTPFSFLSTTGTFPGGIVSNRTYYVSSPTANTFQLSASVGGPVVNLTSAGTGSHLVGNSFVTASELLSNLSGRLAYVTVGQSGSGADYEGANEAPLLAAIASGAKWIHIRNGTYTFATVVTIPAGLRITGSSASATKVTSAQAQTLRLSAGVQIGFLTVEQSASGSAVHVVANLAEIYSCVLVTTTTAGKTLTTTSGISTLRVFDTSFQVGTALLTTVTSASLHQCLFNCPTVSALTLQTCEDIAVTASIFQQGQLTLVSALSVRIVGNHLNDGVTNTTPISSVLLRANTPDSQNNNDEHLDFQNVLSYIGASGIAEVDPPFSNNYGGPAGEDLTSRVGALDVLLQWRFEERNFALIAQTEPFVATWNPTFSTLQTTGPMLISTPHRGGRYVIPAISQSVLNGYALYVTFDRTMANTDVPLALKYAPLGDIRNDLLETGGATPSVLVYQQANHVNGVTFGNAPTVAGVGTFVPTATGLASFADLLLGRGNPSTTGIMRAAIYAVNGSGVPISPALATSDNFNVTNIPAGTFNYGTFSFPSPIVLTQGTTYGVGLIDVSTNGNITWRLNNDVVGGGRYVSFNSGSTWSLQSQEDYAFRIRQEPNPLIPATLGYEDNRHHYVVAFRLGSTLWWRGGGGTRFPGTGGQEGQYFVDGSSKSLLDYLGASDYNDFDPAYSSNFAGLQGESLTSRLGKTDTLLRRLFEYTNVSVSFDVGSALAVESAGANFSLTFNGTLSIHYPHRAGRFLYANQTVQLADGQVMYFTINQASLGASSITLTNSDVSVSTYGSVPMPDAYPLQTKYFAYAWRFGSVVYLYDGTELIVGGRFPTAAGRTVLPTAAAATLSDNIVWNGTHLLWEGLSLMVSTGISPSRNVFANRIAPLAGLTDLLTGEGLVVTHSWNAGANANVVIEKRSLPLANRLHTNQFLWVAREGAQVVFSR